MAALNRTAAVTLGLGLGLVVHVPTLSPANASATATQGTKATVKIKVDRSAKRCTLTLTGPKKTKLGTRSARNGVVRVTLSTGDLPPGTYRVAAKCGKSRVRKTLLRVTSNLAPAPQAEPEPRTLAPTAHPDVSMAATDTSSVEVDVLANDTDPYAEPLRVTGVSVPGHGTASIESQLRVLYTPAPGFVGTDSFTYTIARSDGPTATATATVHVAPQIAIDTFNAVNLARASARECSTGVELPAVAPLAWNTNLAAAATRHSLDMAANNFFADTSPTDGSTPVQRVTHEGYSYRLMAENLVGATHASGDGLVSLLLSSPTHCTNLMDGTYTETGIGYGYNAEATLKNYVTQVLAQPRS